jgi:hypothetical protein
VDDIRVSSWAELTEVLYAESWKKELRRFRSDFAFRGVEVPETELFTGLMRLGGSYPDLEGHLLRNFRKYASRNAVPHDTVWNWLALAQHHGLPTRLLDWTFSPYVALHFVTDRLSRFGQDGVIWCVDFIKVKERLPGRLKEVLAGEGANVFTADMLAEAAATLADFDRLAPEPFPVFFEPPSLDERIVNQFALFSMMSSPTARLDEWLGRHPGLLRRVVVPAGLKWEVRDKLDQANITERVLFPGLDGLSRWLRRQYTPRGETDPPAGGPGAARAD